MKILVVDDSKTSLFLTESSLQKLGHQVIAIQDPTLACATYLKENPDLIILDVVMEPISGYDCSRQIRKVGNDRKEGKFWTPIIFLSARVEDEDIALGIDAGGDDYLTKPVTEMMLKSKIKAMERIARIQDKLLEYSAELEKLSTTDTLTGIPNRHYFEKYIRSVNANASRHKLQFALLFIDLDNFKTVNDTLGHQMGDLLLTQAVTRMRSSLREDDFIARLGGDEFAVILHHIDSPEMAGYLSERIIKVMQPPFNLDNSTAQVTTSIGIACYPEAGEDASTLIKNADIAMYRAKESGRNTAVFFSKTLNDEYLRKVRLELALQLALNNNEFSLVYQPKFELATRRIIGVEVLIRWDHPGVGFISPDEFIPIAEETGLIIPIGRWVIEHAFQQFTAWSAEGIFDFSMAINLSPRQIAKKEILTFIKEMLEIYSIDPSAIELEITETAIMHRNETSEYILNRFHEMGITITIDDFGTGYSSLSHLKALPIDTLKIDKEFVREIPYDENDMAIVKSVLLLSESLGMRVIAEGIESEDQLRFLIDNNCLYGQGYYLSKPISEDDITTFIQEARRE